MGWATFYGQRCKVWASAGQTGRYCFSSEGIPAHSSRTATVPLHASSAMPLSVKQSVAQSNKPLPDLKSKISSKAYSSHSIAGIAHTTLLSQGTSTTVGKQQPPSCIGHSTDSHGVHLCLAPVTPEQSLLHMTLGTKLWFTVHKRVKHFQRPSQPTSDIHQGEKKHHWSLVIKETRRFWRRQSSMSTHSCVISTTQLQLSLFLVTPVVWEIFKLIWCNNQWLSISNLILSYRHIS